MGERRRESSCGWRLERRLGLNRGPEIMNRTEEREYVRFDSHIRRSLFLSLD